MTVKETITKILINENNYIMFDATKGENKPEQ